MQLVNLELLEKISKVKEETNKIWLWYIEHYNYNITIEAYFDDLLQIIDNIEYTLKEEENA